MKKGRVKEIETLAKTRFLSLYKAKYTNKVGEIKEWIISSRKDQETLKAQYFEGAEEKVDAVVLVPIHEESEKIVIIKQFRVPLNDYVYELPAGLIDPNESIESTVERELKEETGLKLKEVLMHKSRSKTYLSAGMTEESAALIYCTCEGELSTAYLEADEDIEPMLLSREEAKILIASDVKMDVKVFMVLQSFVLLGKDL